MQAKRWSELTSTRFKPVALTFSGLRSSRSTWLHRYRCGPKLRAAINAISGSKIFMALHKPRPSNACGAAHSAHLRRVRARGQGNDQYGIPGQWVQKSKRADAGSHGGDSRATAPVVVFTHFGRPLEKFQLGVNQHPRDAESSQRGPDSAHEDRLRRRSIDDETSNENISADAHLRPRRYVNKPWRRGNKDCRWAWHRKAPPVPRRATVPAPVSWTLNAPAACAPR